MECFIITVPYPVRSCEASAIQKSIAPLGWDLTPIVSRVCRRVENDDDTHRRRGRAQVGDPHFLPGRLNFARLVPRLVSSEVRENVRSVRHHFEQQGVIH